MRFGLGFAASLVSVALCMPAEDGASTGLDRRQFDIGSFLKNMNAPPAKVETLEPVLRKDATRKRLWYGPFTLPAQTKGPKKEMNMGGFKMPLQMDPDGIQVAKQLSGWCTDCTVLSAKSALYYGNDTQATVDNGVYEHHIVVVDMTKRTMPFYLCKGQSGFLGTFPAEGFIVSGNDEAANYFTTTDGKFDSGYYIGKSPVMTLQAELVNYAPEPQSIFLTFDYEYLPGRTATNDASVSLLSVTGCNLPDYHAPKDKPQYNMTSSQVPVPHDGYIINAKGHLHDGGVNVLLKLNDKVVCDSRAVYGDDKNAKPSEKLAPNGQKWQVITEMTQCTEAIPVKKGDLLELTSIYDNDAHPPRSAADGHSGDSDEMGVFFLNFAIPNKS